ncbi:MAG: hypothetical protein AAF586_11725 [Planctomycetota bacterium]
MKNWHGMTVAVAAVGALLILGLPELLRAEIRNEHETEHLGPRIVDRARYAIVNHGSPDRPGVWLLNQHTGDVWFHHRDEGNWEHMGTPTMLPEQPNFMDEQPNVIDQP